jgi:hypothetical protein
MLTCTSANETWMRLGADCETKINQICRIMHCQWQIYGGSKLATDRWAENRLGGWGCDRGCTNITFYFPLDRLATLMRSSYFFIFSTADFACKQGLGSFQASCMERNPVRVYLSSGGLCLSTPLTPHSGLRSILRSANRPTGSLKLGEAQAAQDPYLICRPNHYAFRCSMFC